MDVLATGLGLVESPRWHDRRLWFSDWTAGRILRIDDAGGLDEVVRHASLPLCFDFLPDGRLLLVSGPERALLTLEEDGSLSRYADLSALSPYGCNDIVVDGRGNAYVNGAGFDFAQGPPPGDRQPGFVAVVRPDGAAAVVADDIAFPNGMAVTADGRTLVVADSYRSQLLGFDIGDDATLSNRRVWAELGGDNPDGICLDADGAAWYADVPHQHCVRVAEGGAVLATVDLDRGGFACMLGDSDLYVVGARWPGAAALATHADWDGRVWRVPAPAAGAGWPGPHL
ncbi:SMP-30/gluconolactonase/LRE family protein [Nocardioides sp. CER19]|uniref:SMP-30/gluconolactonase/LRE family protein n=1 Tax=Nocardioides sp. CER19 TaxID=3038538 RepID=UPI0024484A0D|nr:SMP-30/gluconolactonase/LRE family protein [Nocardioides sp. CER19]MDH2412655.1 SMP-30/gluconolactonase/LRE family protein [Nocardioides sp. CER19]